VYIQPQVFSIPITFTLFSSLMAQHIGRVCVPVDPSRVAEFDPELVPTIGQLLSELDGAAVEGGEHHSGQYDHIPVI
jgi:hypothetical protein